MILQEYEVRHADQIRNTAAECAVLLKKDGNFPLSAPCPIVLAGNGARHTVKGGTGSGEVNSRFFITAEEGLDRAGFTITSSPWLNDYDEMIAMQSGRKRKRLQKVLAEQGLSGLFLEKDQMEPDPFYDFSLNYDAEVAIYVLSRNSGEGKDRSAESGDFLLTDCEVRDIRFLASHYAKFMLILNVGGIVELKDILQDVPNILLLSQLGVVTGDVLADILLGRANPSGRLTTSWAAINDYPSTDGFGAWDETSYREGIFVGYRYFETLGIKPVFPFGFGLSYTEFYRENAGFSLNGRELAVSAKITNTGVFPGKDVIQIYVTKPVSELPQPYISLVSFAKTRELEPGEAETTTLHIDLGELASYDEKASQMILEAGNYLFWLGSSAEALLPCGAVNVPERIAVKKLGHIGGRPSFKDPEYVRVPSVWPDGLPVLSLEPGVIVTESVSYEVPMEADPQLEKMSDRELALLCLGHYVSGETTSMVGNSGRTVCGAAGETTLCLKECGLDNSLVMADGPAGLRLALEYGEDESGLFPCDNDYIGRMREIFGENLSAEYGMGKDLDVRIRNCKTHTQACTAIPIGTAIAQSFNAELAESYGSLIGEEMELFGIHLWLAPGMNIHRNPLCGRNFEYFSEDPLVSGLMAAAITRGVQSHPGCGTTIKHFCCNNQEFRRTKNSSIVSERALREIYLKGFEIAIRESHPRALMSSYNLVNGIHTSERYDLITDFLRCECGFEGLVMTDWIGTDYETGNGKYRNACAAPSMKAGSELFMPGCEADLDDILRALDDGMLTRSELLRNATRVFDLICTLNAERKELK